MTWFLNGPLPLYDLITLVYLLHDYSMLCWSCKWSNKDDFHAKIEVHTGHIIHFFAGLWWQWCCQCRIIFPLDWKTRWQPKHVLSCWICLFSVCELPLYLLLESFCIWCSSLCTTTLMWFFGNHCSWTNDATLCFALKEASVNKAMYCCCNTNVLTVWA